MFDHYKYYSICTRNSRYKFKPKPMVLHRRTCPICGSKLVNIYYVTQLDKYICKSCIDKHEGEKKRIMEKKFEKCGWTSAQDLGFGKYLRYTKFEELLGKTIVDIQGADVESEYILFACSDGSRYLMFHEQDCCESVTIEDVCGDIRRLLGNPLTKAEESNSGDDKSLDRGPHGGYYDESHTWTYYHLATVKGYVDIRWYGESNGYYSESVDFAEIPPEGWEGK